MAKGKMMPDTTLITSNQIIRIVDLAQVVAKNVTLSTLEKMNLESGVAQDNIITKGGEFQALLRTGFASVVASALNKMSGRKHRQAELIEQYFAEVLGYAIDLTGVVFPEKKGFVTYMAVPTNLDEDQIFSCITTYFEVGQYSWQSPVADTINRKIEQKRPQGIYVFAHVGRDEPDAKHLGKSYDDAMAGNMIFMNPKEYLLATGFHRWVNKNHFMDMNGWTRTSSLWSDGRLVCGYWPPCASRLCLRYGTRDRHHSVDGPRELFLG
jgi:hypothetical protein